MDKRSLPLTCARRQTRLDAFFRTASAPSAKKPRVEGDAASETRPSPRSAPSSASPTKDGAGRGRLPQTTVLLSSASPSPTQSAAMPVHTPSLTSLASSKSSATGMVRSHSASLTVSPTPSLTSSACESSTVSYCSTSSAHLAPVGRRATQPGNGARGSSPASSPPKAQKLKTYYHDYQDLLATASPAPSPRTVSEAQPPTARWGELSVILPWASRNTVVGQNGRAVHAWPLLLRILQEDVARNVNDLTELLQALLIHSREPRGSSHSTFRTLCTVIESLLTARERREFFEEVLPYMRRTVVKGPRCFKSKRVAVLRQGGTKRVLLTGEEAFTLMCCSFFSLFPGRSSSTLFDTASRGRFGVSPKLPAANFDSLFSLPMRQPKRWEAALNKIRCLLEYFFDASRARRAKDARCLEICRVTYGRFPDFAQSGSALQPFELRAQGLIEDDHTALQVDFANRVLGGGVLGQGCVQEEIRFVVSPELMLSRLVAEPLLDNETVFITGARQHSYYRGYADTFRYAEASEIEKTNAATIPSIRSPIHDARGQRVNMPNITVVAMDAVDFHAVSKHESDQYLPTWVDRECRKAFVSFYGAPREYTAAVKSRRGTIATGNWGCGAFGGDVQLKLLIQWCAASEAGRPVHYYVFERLELIESFAPLYAKLVNERWTVGDLFRALQQCNRDAALVSASPDEELRGDHDPQWEAPLARPDLFQSLLGMRLADLRRR